MTVISQVQNGRTVIPVSIRQKMDLRDGDQLIWALNGKVLSATTRRDQLQSVQSKFQKLLPQNTQSLANELIDERRAEANQE